jgi:hypothetical protein
VGQAVYSTDGGSTWSAGTLPSGVAFLDSVSCASTSDCVAAGLGIGDAVYSTDGGSTWSSDTLPSEVAFLYSVSCASTSDCFATGMGNTTTIGALVLSSVTLAPTAVNDHYYTPINTKLVVNAPGVLANDTLNGATIVSHTNPAHGTLILNANGSFTYTPVKNFVGIDSFTYTLTNQYGLTSTATVTVSTLSCASLAGCNLNGANLTNANLSGANLIGANLNRANLTNANLSGANLTGANLNRANLTNANLSGVTVTGTTNFNKVTWSNTICPDSTNSSSHERTCVGHL